MTNRSSSLDQTRDWKSTILFFVCTSLCPQIRELLWERTEKKMMVHHSVWPILLHQGVNREGPLCEPMCHFWDFQPHNLTESGDGLLLLFLSVACPCSSCLTCVSTKQRAVSTLKNKQTCSSHLFLRGQLQNEMSIAGD